MKRKQCLVVCTVIAILLTGCHSKTSIDTAIDRDNIVFHDIRTEEAFLVSAVRKKGKIRFLRIKIRAGEPCRIIPGLDGEVDITSLLTLSPVPANKDKFNSFGIN